jgi:hypothetical protein
LVGQEGSGKGLASAQPVTILEEEIVEAIAIATSVVRGAATGVVRGVVIAVVTSAVLGVLTESLRRKLNTVAPSG